MRRSTLWICALLTIATSGCKQVNEQWAKVKAKIDAARQRYARKPAQPAPAPAVPAPASAPSPSTMDRPVGRHGEPRQEPPVPARPVALADVPYHSNDTGTIAPGMSEKDIYSLWGPPADVRRQGQYTYLFFPNGCEHTCGTADVVILQSGQVVDAVLRWPGHGYSGQSSSPAATPPHGPPRPGGDTLTTKSPSTP
ncbi:MAG TPA: hypothetical protein VM716_14020 [Gemmatimonadales bacterium]|nr:hypothetical protein [Gemmatimonadales bacterium]